MKRAILITGLILAAPGPIRADPDPVSALRARVALMAELRHGHVLASGAWPGAVALPGAGLGDGSQTPGRPASVGPFPGMDSRSGVRSIPLAFGLSAAVPGAGQAFNRQFVKAGVALAVEAIVALVWSSRRSDGRAAEEDVEAFAHDSWSAGRYAAWLNDFVGYLGQTYGHQVSATPAVAPEGVDFSHPEAWTDAQRADVGRFFGQIQAIERQVFHPETGASFSHQIPHFGAQQYYELIGKYFQFAPGWEDYPAWSDGTGGYTVAIDPERSGEGGTKPNVSPTFYRYAREHAAAQDLLRSARRLSMLFIVNHLAAAVDAAVSAKLHNDRLSAGVSARYGPTGALDPVAVLAWRL